jgi:hypothetical protein
MSNVTRLLEEANRGDSQAASELLPLVYDELWKQDRSAPSSVLALCR